MTMMPHPATGFGESFESGGRRVTLEWYPATAGAGPRPAVVMLHGADGLDAGHGYRTAAGAMAASGRHVALLHYLDRTGERRASFATLFRNFTLWMGTLRDAVTHLSDKPAVAGDRVAVIGISLGGALALATAAEDERIRAVVATCAPLPQPLADRGARLPPTLVLHGAEDGVVSVDNARNLARLLKAQGTPHELVVYPHEGHRFTAATQADAGLRAVAFLDRHV